MVFCCILQYFDAKSVFFCNLRCFVAKSVLVRFTRFCVEKNLATNCARGEEMTNMRYDSGMFGLLKSALVCFNKQTKTDFN